jgi:ethanolamine utilization protein EutN
MILGRVVGQVWATRRDARLGRAKLLVVRPTGIYEPAFGENASGEIASGETAFGARHLVATDDLDAGIGDQVVVCLGAPARASAGGNDVPVDAAVMAVVDRAEIDLHALGAAGAGPGIRRKLTEALG